MARFYATFDNSTNGTLEGTSTTYSFNRLTFTNGATLKTNLLNARSALSAQMYTDMATVDQDGTRGVVVPTDGYTRSGGNLTWTELYTKTAAVWPSNPRERPTATITVANSTLITPSVADGSVTETYYTDAQTALQNALAGIAGSGPYARLGPDPWTTLVTLHNDHDMTYFAWDDFLPGRPTSIAVNVSTTNIIVTGLSNYEYNMDRHATIYVSYAGRIIKSGTPQSVSGNTTVAAGSTEATLAHGVTGLTGGVDTWDTMDIITYYTLTNQGVYPTALGAGSITASGSNRTLTNQSGTIDAL